MLGFRSPFMARVIVLGDLPIRCARAAGVSPVSLKYLSIAFITRRTLPNRQIAVKERFACQALASVAYQAKL